MSAPPPSASVPTLRSSGLDDSPEHALGLIDKIVSEVRLPRHRASSHARPGLRPSRRRSEESSRTSTTSRSTTGRVRSTSCLRRFAEYQEFEGAFGRRA